MSMFNNTVRYAVAAAIAGTAAGSANALDISTYHANATTNVNVYISGSTALDGTLTNAAIQVNATQPGMCQSGTTDIYLIGSVEKLIYCSATAASGLTAGTPLAIFKESQVGSANGVQPLINVAQGGSAGTIFIDPTVITDATCGTATTTAATGDFGQYVTHPSCASTAVVAGTPIGGFADVEAAILLTAGGQAISAALTSSDLTAFPTLDQVWGVPVTKKFYYDLQAAEGLTATCPATYTQYGVAVTGTSFLGKDSPSCAPSLSRQQLASIYSQQIQADVQLGLSNSTDSQIYICRRDFGSGTEASFEAYFVSERCSKTSLSIPGEDGATVWANASAGAMRTCLQAFQVGGIKLTGFYATTSSITTVGNQYAIGMLNTEITAANLSGAGDAFRMVAVDGVMPQLSNLQNGTYPYFSTGNAYQIKAGKTGAPTGPAATAFTAIRSKIGHPLWTADSNTNYSSNPWGVTGDQSPAGNGGYASTNPPTLPATHSTAATNPTAAFTKTASGSINNCDQPVFDSTDLTTAPLESVLLGTGNVNN
jgi:ABC-type phosphate transport system substrate-binding protein